MDETISSIHFRRKYIDPAAKIMSTLQVIRAFVDESFRIEHSEENGFDYIADQNGLATREKVERLMEACRSHLEHLTAENIESALADWRTQRDAECSTASAPRPLPVGFVYLMRNERNGLTKIGFSKRPEFREKTLQSEEPEVRLLASWPGTMATEEFLHLQFMSKHVRGEWFHLKAADVLCIRQYFEDKARLEVTSPTGN